jgi:5-methylcytosine-specific restriction endonuclease McrA
MKFELDSFKNRNVTDEELLQDLVAVDTKLKVLGQRLTSRAYGGHGRYSAATIQLRFGSWNEGLKRAELASGEERNIPTESLFDNLKLVWIAKGKQPVCRDLNAPPSRYTSATYSNRFGSWKKALEEFVAFVNQEQNDIVSYEVEVRSHRIAKRTKRDPSLGLRFLVLKRDNFCCVTCGRSPATVAGLVLEIDHVFPWSEGGETIEENLQSLCFDCNRGKGARC